FKLGLFDAPETVPFSSLSTAIVDSPAHRDVARQAAAESIVLLKNAEGILPLRRDPASVLVVGPTAANPNALLGNYAGVSPRLITLQSRALGFAAVGPTTSTLAGNPNALLGNYAGVSPRLITLLEGIAEV